MNVVSLFFFFFMFDLLFGHNISDHSLHLTTFCLQYKPTVIACVCIHLACKWSNWEIPVSTDGKHWWEYVDPSVTLELLDGKLYYLMVSGGFACVLIYHMFILFFLVAYKEIHKAIFATVIIIDN